MACGHFPTTKKCPPKIHEHPGVRAQPTTRPENWRDSLSSRQSTRRIPVSRTRPLVPQRRKSKNFANTDFDDFPQIINHGSPRHSDCADRVFFFASSSKRRKFVADGVFYAELNEFFQRELAEEGYSGVEVRVTPTVTDIIIRATHTQEVLGEQGRRIRELTSLIQKRFKFPENSVSLYAAKVQNRGLSAVAQCESLRYKLLNGLAVRRACYGVLRFIMESGAKGCEVVVSGKLRAARAKSMKFTDGFMIHSGQPAKDFIDHATRHVLLRQGVLGIKVKIMRGSDPEGKAGPQKSLPDAVTIIEPKEEQAVLQPVSQDYGAKAAQAQAAQDARVAEQQEGGEEAEPTEQ
ncbi:40S ribosomal protein S3 [Paramyrothecium foliicola]|nr:40S ribosomal protein S3 [Paramyrothecium foliicola]